LLLLLLFGVSLLAPSTARAQDAVGEDAIPPSPIEQLLEKRAALNLSSDQLSRLDEVKQRLAAQNDPLVNQMMALRQQWQQARRAARNGRANAPARVERIRAEAQETRAKIQQNNKAAMQEVNRLLKPPQRKQLRGIIQERRDDTRGRRAGSGSNAGNRR
jgi:DNA anti-recombination protein RmuC